MPIYICHFSVCGEIDLHVLSMNAFQYKACCTAVFTFVNEGPMVPLKMFLLGRIHWCSDCYALGL